MTKNNARSEGKETQKITYQPFLLAVAFLAMLGKLVISISTGQPLLDWLLIVVVILFVGALIVYVWDRSKSKRSKQSVSITTGTAEKSTIMGVKTDAAPPDEEIVTIKTKDVKGSKITGVDRREKN